MKKKKKKKNIKFLSSRHFFQLNKKSSQTVTEIRRKIQGEQLLPSKAAVTSLAVTVHYCFPWKSFRQTGRKMLLISTSYRMKMKGRRFFTLSYVLETSKATKI